MGLLGANATGANAWRPSWHPHAQSYHAGSSVSVPSKWFAENPQSCAAGKPSPLCPCCYRSSSKKHSRKFRARPKPRPYLHRVCHGAAISHSPMAKTPIKHEPAAPFHPTSQKDEKASIHWCAVNLPTVGKPHVLEPNKSGCMSVQCHGSTQSKRRSMMSNSVQSSYRNPSTNASRSSLTSYKSCNIRSYALQSTRLALRTCSEDTASSALS